MTRMMIIVGLLARLVAASWLLSAPTSAIQVMSREDDDLGGATSFGKLSAEINGLGLGQEEVEKIFSHTSRS